MMYPQGQRTEGSLLQMLHYDERAGRTSEMVGSPGGDPLAPTARTMSHRSFRSPAIFTWNIRAALRR
jgi:hypothetical protein